MVFFKHKKKESQDRSRLEMKLKLFSQLQQRIVQWSNRKKKYPLLFLGYGFKSKKDLLRDNLERCRHASVLVNGWRKVIVSSNKGLEGIDEKFKNYCLW